MYSEQRKILKVLNQMQKQRQSFTETELRNLTRIFDTNRLVKLCRNLKEEGYLESFSESHNTITSIELSYKGIIYKQIIRTKILDHCFAWFSEHILELATLILSVIALLRTL